MVPRLQLAAFSTPCGPRLVEKAENCRRGTPQKRSAPTHQGLSARLVSLAAVSCLLRESCQPAAHVFEQLVDRQHPLLAGRRPKNRVIPTLHFHGREDLVANLETLPPA